MVVAVAAADPVVATDIRCARRSVDGLPDRLDAETPVPDCCMLCDRATASLLDDVNGYFDAGVERRPLNIDDDLHQDLDAGILRRKPIGGIVRRKVELNDDETGLAHRCLSWARASADRDATAQATRG